jgi:hypothetical protein
MMILHFNDWGMIGLREMIMPLLFRLSVYKPGLLCMMPPSAKIVVAVM